MSYAAHRPYVAPALASADLPRLVMGVVAVELLYSLCLSIIDAGLALLPEGAARHFYFGDTALGLLSQLLSFTALGAMVVVIARLQHHRGFFSLIGPPLTGLRHLAYVCAAVLAVFAVVDLLPPWWDASLIEEVRPPLFWLLLLPLSMLGLLLQTGAEELFYRGYIQQQIAARYDSPLVWLVVPNVLFAMSHWDNGSSATDSAQYVIWAFFFGLAASDLTARTGTLGAAIGFHLANNAYAFLLFAERDGPDSGLALLLFAPDTLSPGGDAGPVLTSGLVVELVTLGLMWLAARIVIRR